MRHTRILIAIFAVSLMAGCETPISSKREKYLLVEKGLGSPEKIVDSGVYKLAELFVPESGEWVKFGDFVKNLETEEKELPNISEYFAVQWHPGTKTYATSSGNIRFYNLDGEYYIMAANINIGDIESLTIYLPAKLSEEELLVYIYKCSDIPNNYRVSKGLDKKCITDDMNVVLRAFGLLDFDKMPKIKFKKEYKVRDFVTYK